MSEESHPLPSPPLPAAITTGQRSPSYLVYSTAGADYPGGLAGRIKGITTVFILAVLLGKSRPHLPYSGIITYVCQAVPESAFTRACQYVVQTM